MKKLIIYGDASKREIVKIDVSYRDYETGLLDFLLENNIPVASSCGGEGVCQKCVATLNFQKILSCQKCLRELFKDTDEQTLIFSYL